MTNPMTYPMGNPNSPSQCYGRTDGLTKNPITAISRLSAVDAGAHMESCVSLGDVLASGQLWIGQERHEVTRSGDRQEIPPHVRVAVWLRDRGKCEHCQTRVPKGQPWHLDHIVPWSAGGSDRTTNLRVLCEKHNMDRSNRVDPTERDRRAATWWCTNCYDHERGPWVYVDGLAVCPTHRRNPNACRVMNGYARWQQLHDEWPTWHERSAMTNPDQISYCAHCDAPGLTDMPL